MVAKDSPPPSMPCRLLLVGERPRPLDRIKAPTRAAVRTFLSQLRGPYRGAACRGVIVGGWVILVLRQRGLRPMLRDRLELPEGDPVYARRVGLAVEAGLGMLPVHVTCLRRSLTLQRELQRSRCRAVLSLGVRKVNGELNAHAWVEVAGEVVNDSPAIIATFLPLCVGDAERLLTGAM